ncbi:MAG: hypothetical protein K6G64_02400 [Eubacterium sp.]|nr:hypothetical protein [Eubacterium sp.]
MENYQILTLSSGQPLILYQENEKVYMYTVYSGRIQSHGIVFDDVSGKLSLQSGEVNYVSYISTHGRLRLYHLKDMRFLELLSLSNDAEEYREFLHCRLHSFQAKVFLFYSVHNPEDSSNALFYVSMDSLQKSALLYQGNYSFQGFSLMNLPNAMLIAVFSKEQTTYFEMDSSLQIRPFQNTVSPSSTIDSKTLEKELQKQKQHCEALQQELYQKNNEILALKSTQKHITEQYNDLADFSGKLQEELRKVRYL